MRIVVKETRNNIHVIVISSNQGENFYNYPPSALFLFIVMTIRFSILLSALAIHSALAQGAKPMDIGASEQAIGTPGVVWYATWDTAMQEATRSGKPIFFMAAAAQCGGISGVF